MSLDRNAVAFVLIVRLVVLLSSSAELVRGMAALVVTIVAIVDKKGVVAFALMSAPVVLNVKYEFVGFVDTESETTVAGLVTVVVLMSSVIFDE